MADSNATSATRREQILGMVTSELEYKVELHKRLVDTCFNKCVDQRYKEGELNIGENSCVDRCVLKYWQVNNIVGQVLQSRRPAM